MRNTTLLGLIESKTKTLKGDLLLMPAEKSSDANNVDLDISDKNGNILARIKDGHIQTKKFDSNDTKILKGSNATGVDLDISDESGNVIARFKNGNIITKEFDSEQSINGVKTYSKTVVFECNEFGEKFITQIEKCSGV